MSDWQQLGQNSAMPFGKYKGFAMKDVPAEYLHWFWTNSNDGEKLLVLDYIKRNMKELKKEHPNGVWE